MLSSRHLLFFHFRQRHSNWKCRSIQNNKELSAKLVKLNALDKVVVLEHEKEQVKKLVPVDHKIAIDNISDLDLLKNIKYLYSFYSENLTLENKINLRKDVNHILKLYNVTEEIHKILVDILQKRKAL